MDSLSRIKLITFALLLMTLFISVIKCKESQDIKINLPLPLCPCYEIQICNQSFSIPSLQYVGSREIKHLLSTWFTEHIEEPLQCPQNYIHTFLTDGSFALLQSTDVIQLHSRVHFPYGLYCYRQSLEEEYLISSQYKPDLKLEAEVCLPQPKINLCCKAGQILWASNAENHTVSCVENNDVLHVPPKIYFDGRLHDWVLNETLGDFPSCFDSLSLIPIGDANGFGKISLVGEELQFSWKGHHSNKIYRVTNSNFCIGQINSYGFSRPAVAFCQSFPDENECSKTEDIPCFSKCCPEDSLYDLETLSCQPAPFSSTWLPDEFKIGNFSYTIGLPKCKHYTIISMDIENFDHTRLLSNGSLYVNAWNETLSPPHYCVDYFRNRTHLTAQAMTCYETPQNDFPEEQIDPLAYGILLFIFSLILMITLVIFTVKMLSKDKRNSSNIFYVVAMVFISTYVILGSFALGIQQILHDHLSPAFCMFFAGLYECLSLSSLYQLSFIVAEQYFGSCNRPANKIWQRILLITLPLFLSILFSVLNEILNLEFEGCPVDASMIDPWQSYVITCAHALMLLLCPVLLFLTFRNYNYGIMISASSSNIDSAEQNYVAHDEKTKGEALDRWWLNTKLWATFLIYEISYIAVWKRYNVAFWLYADITVMLKCIVISVSLVRVITYRSRNVLPPNKE